MDQENMNKKKMECKKGASDETTDIAFFPLALLRALNIWIPVFITTTDFLGKRSRTSLGASPEPSPP